MLRVHVHVQVKPDQVEAFRSATLENARHSIKEPGIARFDVLQQQDDPTRFVLVEVYRTTEDPARHKETPHYQKWRDTVADMMAQPRTSIKYTNIFPDDRGQENSKGKTKSVELWNSTVFSFSL
jgi:quinol monooxygenase YgiN